MSIFIHDSVPQKNGEVILKDNNFLIQIHKSFGDFAISLYEKMNKQGSKNDYTDKFCGFPFEIHQYLFSYRNIDPKNDNRFLQEEWAKKFYYDAANGINRFICYCDFELVEKIITHTGKISKLIAFQ